MRIELGWVIRFALVVVAASIPGCDNQDEAIPGAPNGPDLDELVCPSGLTGPNLIRIQTATAVYCMDQREVTWGEYKAFLAAQVSAAEQPSACSWNSSFEPEYYEPDPIREVDPTNKCHIDTQPTSDDVPASCVDFCDALAYCAWAKKRLCSRIGGPAKWGTPNMSPASADKQAISTLAGTTEMEFTNSCTQGGQTAFAYGDSYEPAKCIDAKWIEQSGPQSLAVTNFDERECHGTSPGFEQLHDLSGSVSEWQDLCWSSESGGTCLNMGSSWAEADASRLSCTGSVGFASMKVKDGALGFRCCADAVP